MGFAYPPLGDLFEVHSAGLLEGTEQLSGVMAYAGLATGGGQAI